MKADIHPDYVEATVTCSCGNTFQTRSTMTEIHIELCNECHPFYTGKQKLVDSGGRVERFQRRYGKKTFTRSGSGAAPAVETAPAAEPTGETEAAPAVEPAPAAEPTGETEAAAEVAAETAPA